MIGTVSRTKRDTFIVLLLVSRTAFSLWNSIDIMLEGKGKIYWNCLAFGILITSTYFDSGVIDGNIFE